MAELTYPDGWDAAIARFEARRAPLRFAPGEALPALDCDLVPLLHRPVAPPPEAAAAGEKPSAFAQKRQVLAAEFLGQPEILLLHGLLIACLRKRAWPDQAPGLFFRLWTEQGPALAGLLPGRWLISAAITFADHGRTPAERHLGQSLKVLFSLLKLTEFERLYSGFEPEQPFRLGRKVKAPLPMGIEPFSLRDGGLDINLLAPLVLEARQSPVLGPLALELLDRLNQDPGTIFRRIARMRDNLLARQKTS